MADKSANIIELNGKQYDARTGQLLARTRSTGMTQHDVVVAKPAPSQTAKTQTSVAAISKKPHAVAPHANNHKAQKPQTLMRRAVLKPVVENKPRMKVQTLAKKQPGVVSVNPKVSAGAIHASRAQQALRVQKSDAVSRFSKPQQFKTLAAKKDSFEPQLAATSSHTLQTAKEAFFQKALANSTSHAATINPKKAKNSAKLKKTFKRQKSVFLVAASVSVLVIVGSFVAIANMSTLELKVASVRAGLNANLPSYQPEGYSKSGPVAFSSGKVTISFKADDNSDRNYKVTQEESDWNSQTLFDSVIATSNQPHQSVQQNGNTIYLYGSSQATWVSGGIRYNVSGNANLSTDQLLNIADSI